MELHPSELKKITVDILDVKKDILKMIYLANSGHPGGSLSCTSIIYLLYKKIMRIDPKNPNWADRDIFILSKGHAAPALYAILSRIGYIDKEKLDTFRRYGSELQGHPVRNIENGIEVSTGSLGMGLSIGLGYALAAKLENQLEKTIYVLLGDGELNEGAIWEAAMAASHYKADNLIAIIDRNGIQSDGATEKIMALEPLADKWRSFGWDVIEVDGTNINNIIQGFNKSKQIIKKPKVIISYLVKGSDVSFMEHSKQFHGRPPNKEEYEIAIKEIENLKNQISGE